MSFSRGVSMPNERLDNLARTGGLKVEAPNAGEIAGLVHSGIVRLNDAKNAGLSLESRFDPACNAAHALSLAALRIAGCRAENRYIVFQCLRHTLEFPNEKWRVLDQAHRKRNVAEYEGAVEVDENLVEALVRAAGDVASRVSDIGAGLEPDGE